MMNPRNTRTTPNATASSSVGMRDRIRHGTPVDPAAIAGQLTTPRGERTSPAGWPNVPCPSAQHPAVVHTPAVSAAPVSACASA